MADFSSIPIRRNDQRFDASWWNTIRTALVENETVPTVTVYATDAEYETAKGGAGEEGDFYYNSTDNKLKFHNGVEWKFVEDNKNNYSATTAPNNNNDSSEGYSVGSVWTDVALNKVYVCINSGVGTSVWLESVDTTSAQTLESKTIDGASNTITNLTHGDQVDNPTSGVHGVTTNIVGVGDIQTLTNKTIGDDITIQGDLTVVGDYYGGDVIEVTDPAITVNKDGAQSSANNVAGIEVDMSDADNAKITYDSSLTSKWKVGDVVSQDEIVTATAAQDVSNKAVITPSRLDPKQDTYANLVTYAATATDGQLCFATDLKKNYSIYDGLLNEISGGGGQGGINYITNWNAEENLNDWTNTGSLTFGLETTSPLFDAQSFKLSSAGGADYSGNKLETPFTIDNGLKFNPLDCVIQVNNADLQTGDFSAKIYDVDNAGYISLTYGEEIVAANYTTPHKFGFQATDSVNYKLEIYTATTSTSAYDFIFDNVKVGPAEPAVIGAPVTDWEDFTPTGSWASNATYEGQYRRIGDSAEFRVSVNTSGAVSGSLTIALPAGLSIDTSKIPAAGNNISKPLGYGTSFENGVNAYDAIVTYSSTTSVGVRAGYSATTYLTYPAAYSPTVPFTFGAGDSIGLSFKVPIAGWSSGVVMSETTMNTEISLSAYLGSSQVITSTSATTVVFNVTDVDTTNSYNTTNGKYIVPEDGNYYVDSTLFLDGVVNPEIMVMRINVNGIILASNTNTNFKNVYGSIQLSKLLPLKKDDELEIIIKSSSDTNYTVYFGKSYSNLSLTKVNVGTQTIAKEPPVYVIASDDSGAAKTASYSVMVYGTVRSDNYNSYNNTTGTFTAPRPGLYSFLTTLGTSDNSTAANEYIELLHSNSSYGNYAYDVSTHPSGITQCLVQVKSTAYLEKGDTWYPRTRGTWNGSTWNLLNFGPYNRLEIYSID